MSRWLDASGPGEGADRHVAASWQELRFLSPPVSRAEGLELLSAIDAAVGNEASFADRNAAALRIRPALRDDFGGRYEYAVAEKVAAHVHFRDSSSRNDLDVALSDGRLKIQVVEPVAGQRLVTISDDPDEWSPADSVARPLELWDSIADLRADGSHDWIDAGVREDGGRVFTSDTGFLSKLVLHPESGAVLATEHHSGTWHEWVYGEQDRWPSRVVTYQAVGQPPRLEFVFVDSVSTSRADAEAALKGVTAVDPMAQVSDKRFDGARYRNVDQLTDASRVDVFALAGSSYRTSLAERYAAPVLAAQAALRPSGRLWGGPVGVSLVLVLVAALAGLVWTLRLLRSKG